MRHASTIACVVLAIAGSLFAGADPAVDPRNIVHGLEIPDEGYCDQPYVVVLPDGSWLCTMTTGPAQEGDGKQHVVSTISTDKGKTWGRLTDIEPHGPPEASWVMPLLVPSGRVYVFYDYNGENMREVLTSTGTTKRVDTLGWYVLKFSDDGGQSWSADRYRIPIRTFEIDRENPYGGEVQFFWGVGKPIVVGDAAYIGLAKVGRFGAGFIERSEGIFLRSGNILIESDPNKIEWETLPDGDIGLRAPAGLIAEEHNLTWLDSGALFCTYRTVDGHPCHAYSVDGGKTWTGPEYMAYGPGGPLVRHPRAANFVRRFSNGRYLYWFHNHGGKSYEGRNPVWLLGGREVDGWIQWSQPEIFLYDDDPKTRMSYPDFIEDGGRVYVTETQKTVARVHEIPQRILNALWQKGANETATEGILLEWSAGPSTSKIPLPTVVVPSTHPTNGMTIEMNVRVTALPESLITASDGAGNGLAIRISETGAVDVSLGKDDQRSNYQTEPGLIAKGAMHRVTLIADYGPRILMFVVDGRLTDGGATHESGWHRIDPSFDGFDDALLFQPSDSLESLRVYGRARLVNEIP